jgi:hypothetical protein
VAILPDLTGQIVAYDNCSSSIRVTQSPAPGASLSAGTTSVIFWVDDGNGNTNNCSATITVTDQTLPVITLQPVSQTNNVGTSASFSAAASSCSALSYAWYHGTNLLAGQTNATVTINPAGSADAGAYQAVVSSVAGTTNSQTAILTIVNQVPVIVSSAILPDGTFQLIFQATPGQTYHVLGTDDLTTPLPDWPILTNGTFGSTNAIYTEMATNAQQFYIIESP